MSLKRVVILLLTVLQLGQFFKMNYNHYRSIVLCYFDENVDEIAKYIYNSSLPVYSYNMNMKFDHFANELYEGNKLFVMVLGNFNDSTTNLTQTILRIPFYKVKDHTILLIKSINANINKTMEDFFKECFKHFIINVGIQFSVNGTKYKYSYNGFKRNFLQTIENNELFPDKTQNLHGFQLRVSAFNDTFLFMGKLNETYGGIDGFVGETIFKTMNATRIYLTRKSDFFHSVHFGETLLDTHRGKVDMCFNSRFLKTELFLENKIDTTYPHDRDDLVVLVPRNTQRPLKSLENLATPKMYLLIAFSYFLFYLYLYKMADKIVRPKVALLVLQIMLNLPSPVVPVRNFRRMFCIYAFVSVILASAFQSKLASMLTAPEDIKQMKTIQDLIDSKLDIATVDRYADVLNMTMDRKIWHQLENRISTVIRFHAFGIMSVCQNRAVILKKHLALFGIVIDKFGTTKGEPCHIMLQESAVPAFVVYIVSPGSPFLERINSILSKLIESGLYIHNKNNILINVKKILLSKRNLVGEEAGLSMKVMKSTFTIWIFGICIAGIAFMGEIVYFWFKKMFF